MQPVAGQAAAKRTSPAKGAAAGAAAAHVHYHHHHLMDLMVDAKPMAIVGEDDYTKRKCVNNLEQIRRDT